MSIEKITEILTIGEFLKTDSSGYIVSESHVDKIIAPWKEAIEEMKNAYIDHIGDQIHSIYVRGTVARGKAIEGISDIDTFAVIDQEIATIDRSWIYEKQKELKNTYSFATDFEFDFVPYRTLFKGDTFFIDRFTIKTQGACIYGEDLAQKILPFRPDLQTASHFSRNLQQVFIKAKKNILSTSDVFKIQEWCRWVMKRIVRGGFILVMDREGVFTRDLYPSYKTFSKHFTEQEPQMKKALYLAINPTDNIEEIIDFLDDFGVWLANQIEKKFIYT